MIYWHILTPLVHLMTKISKKFWNWIPPKTYSEPKPEVPFHLIFDKIDLLVIQNNPSLVESDREDI